MKPILAHFDLWTTAILLTGLVVLGVVSIATLDLQRSCWIADDRETQDCIHGA